MKRKYYITRDDLDRNQIWIEWDEVGQPIVKQAYQPTATRNRGAHWNPIRPIYELKKPLKDGSEYNALVTNVRIDDKIRTLCVSNIVWIYHYGEIGEYDIDHIDDNPHNNALENLQRLTHAQNLAKRAMHRKNKQAKESIAFSTITSGQEEELVHTDEYWRVDYDV